MEIGLAKGQVVEIIKDGPVAEIKVATEIGLRDALHYSRLLGQVEVGHEVVINTTAVDLNLGSGGFDFVVVDLNNLLRKLQSSGHIMKLRYTPFQLKVWSEEEKEEILESITTPVILAELHSMLVPAAFGIWSQNPKLTVGYIMTDGGALPIDYSGAVGYLKKSGYQFLTYTAGDAFGGDKEAVNIYSALGLAAKECDVIIMGMGPGVVGTETILGTTALEVGTGINAVGSLGGRPIVIPRLMRGDKRGRHQGISHHTLTSLQKIALKPAEVVFTNTHWLEIDLKPHKIVLEKAPLLDYSALPLKTMGRGFGEEAEFFLTAAASGAYAAKQVGGGGERR
mgnify:FL=1